MIDYSVEPFVTIGEGKNKLYKFKRSPKIYTEKEFKTLLKNSLNEGKDEVKPKARKTDKQDNTTEPTED